MLKKHVENVSVLKSAMRVEISLCFEIYNACWKLCWKYTEEASWNSQCLLKCVMYFENYVGSMLKFSGHSEICNAY